MVPRTSHCSAPRSVELAAGGQSGDGVRLVLPLGPGKSLGKVGTLSVVEHQRFNHASPRTQGFARPWQVDTPLMHVQGLGAEVHLGQVRRLSEGTRPS